MAEYIGHQSAPQANTTRRCNACGARFQGRQSQKFCAPCWSWRLISWHVTCAARALGRQP
jgi:rRNA maturation endonuclease Nob1